MEDLPEWKGPNGFKERSGLVFVTGVSGDTGGSFFSKNWLATSFFLFFFSCITKAFIFTPGLVCVLGKYMSLYMRSGGFGERKCLSWFFGGRLRWRRGGAGFMSISVTDQK